jgi:hypothetical protein
MPNKKAGSITNPTFLNFFNTSALPQIGQEGRFARRERSECRPQGEGQEDLREKVGATFYTF